MLMWGLLCSVLVTVGCSRGDGPGDSPEGASSAVSASGPALFQTHCQRCHGPAATGSKNGPPLVHKIYEPSHHPDVAFQRAVSLGVRAHHWQFGNMPRIGRLDTAQVERIIAYLRGLQREAGIH